MSVRQSSASPQVPTVSRRARSRVFGLTLGLLGLSSVALAASWSGFDAAFPGLPCSDGWAACIVNGTVVSPGMVLDKGGRPHPGHMRAGFYDLDPLPGFSPFVGLSPYTGEEAEAPEAVASRPSRDNGGGGGSGAAAGGGTPSRVDDRGGDLQGGAGDAVADVETDDGREDPGQIEVLPEDPVQDTTPTATASSTGSGGGDLLGADPMGGGTQLSSSAPTGGTSLNPNRVDPSKIVLATDDGGAATTTATTPATTTATKTETTTASTARTDAAETTAPAVADVSVPKEAPPPPPPPPPAEPEGCDDLVSLEAPSMMGQLGVSRRKCIEGKLGSSSQTTKNKLSRLLIIDAEARGDKAEWERLMKRHLEDIDRSDPDLCFKYAIHLSRGGAGRAHGVIRWADYSLENKQQWSGNTYKKRVYALYKLRAEAANRLWTSAEKKYVEDRNDENEGKVTKYRGLTKDYSREWLDYARASAQDQKSPLALCVSSSGSTEFCSG